MPSDAMIAISRDAAWAERLCDLAVRGGWPFVATDSVPDLKGSAVQEHALVVLDRALIHNGLPRALAGLRGLFPWARIVLAFTESELGAEGAAAVVSSGADDIVLKSWPAERQFVRLAALRDAALASAVRVSADGNLKAEKRSHRAFVRVRARWAPLELPAAEFALLWRLLTAEPESASRAELLEALRAVGGREVEIETVSRRTLSLRRALVTWKGKLESVRGGRYRLVSSLRRSTT